MRSFAISLWLLIICRPKNLKLRKSWRNSNRRLKMLSQQSWGYLFICFVIPFVSPSKRRLHCILFNQQVERGGKCLNGKSIQWEKWNKKDCWRGNTRILAWQPTEYFVASYCVFEEWKRVLSLVVLFLSCGTCYWYCVTLHIMRGHHLPPCMNADELLFYKF